MNLKEKINFPEQNMKSYLIKNNISAVLYEAKHIKEITKKNNCYSLIR